MDYGIIIKKIPPKNGKKATKTAPTDPNLAPESGLTGDWELNICKNRYLGQKLKFWSKK